MSSVRVPVGGKVGQVIEVGQSDRGALEYLSGLVYELLDAHTDTADLARRLDIEPDWAAHLDYLRDLQRIAREGLARLASGDR